MGCLFFSGFFWGSLLVVLGASIILNVLFHVNIPILRILFALVLIYFGVRVLLGPACCRFRETVSFGESNINAASTAGNEYHVLFGKGVIDLTGIPVGGVTARKRVATVFGSSTLKIDPSLPVVITVNAAFAAARMPDGNVISFGTYTYHSPGFREGVNALFIDASVVFGELNVVAVAKQ